MKTPNLRHLNIALQVSRNHGFSNVSKIVNLSPSAITQAMKSLEDTLGTKIFDRSPTGVFPNQVGEIYLDRVARAFEALKQAERAIDRNKNEPRIDMRITMSQLHAIIAVVESGSYSLAARRLGLSQPSVYKAARSLQNLFDRQLFRPSPLGVEPTHYAREFVRHASIALSEIERGHEEILEYQGRMEGRVAIGTLPLVRTRILPSAITKLLAMFPDCQIEILDGVYDDLLAALRHGSLDILLGALRNPPPIKDISQTPLFEDELAIIVRAGHPITELEKPGFQDLTGLEWIVPRNPTPTRTYFENMFPRNGYNVPTRIIETSSLMAIRALLYESDRAAILSPRQAIYEIENNDLEIVTLRLESSGRSIGMTVRENWKPTGIQARFIEILRAETHGLSTE